MKLKTFIKEWAMEIILLTLGIYFLTGVFLTYKGRSKYPASDGLFMTFLDYYLSGILWFPVAMWVLYNRKKRDARI